MPHRTQWLSSFESLVCQGSRHRAGGRRWIRPQPSDLSLQFLEFSIALYSQHPRRIVSPRISPFDRLVRVSDQSIHDQAKTLARWIFEFNHAGVVGRNSGSLGVIVDWCGARLRDNVVVNRPGGRLLFPEIKNAEVSHQRHKVVIDILKNF